MPSGNAGIELRNSTWLHGYSVYAPFCREGHITLRFRLIGNGTRQQRCSDQISGVGSRSFWKASKRARLHGGDGGSGGGVVSQFTDMEGSDSVTSPDLELVAGPLDLGTIFDVDMEDFVHGRRTLFAVCAYALLKAIPGLRALVDDIPHHSYDVGHVGGEPKTVTVNVQALMDELLSEIDYWCLEKDYENSMNMVLMQVSFTQQTNDLLLFESSTKWGCYNCAVHFTRMECSKSIYMDGRSVSEFEEECYLDCHECKIAVGYKRMKVCKLPQVLNFYEVSGLLPELRILNQFLTAHLLHLSVQCPSVSTRPCITTADPGQMRNCNVPKDLSTYYLCSREIPEPWLLVQCKF
uniref:Uncharacterized protein n=1 Tax=Oryza rufipogon TaxID=4529 RepID=A0A0E0PRE5_ORYRU